MPGSKWRLLKWLVGGGQGSGGDAESGGENLQYCFLLSFE